MNSANYSQEVAKVQKPLASFSTPLIIKVYHSDGDFSLTLAL